LQDRIKLRKACWKSCENTWKVNTKEQRSILRVLSKRYAKKICSKNVLAVSVKNAERLPANSSPYLVETIYTQNLLFYGVHPGELMLIVI